MGSVRAQQKQNDANGLVIWIKYEYDIQHWTELIYKVR